ncbi:MAG: methyltransferase [Pseudomonadota bacterium]
MIETTDNAFLGGRLHILQPKAGYRAGADPVFLAAAVDAKPGQSVLDLGCGVGTAMLCLSARVPDLVLTGVDLQEEMVHLATENMARNGVEGAVSHASIVDLPADLKSRRFDHVMSNPPFFDRAKGSQAHQTGRELGRGETLGVSAWIDAALKRVLPGGQITLVGRVERLPEYIASIGPRAGGVKVLPLAPRRTRPAKLFLLRAISGSNAPFCLLPPFVLHQGDHHEKDGESYSAEAQAVLRNGAALPFNN